MYTTENTVLNYSAIDYENGQLSPSQELEFFGQVIKAGHFNLGFGGINVTLYKTILNCIHDGLLSPEGIVLVDLTQA